MLKTTPMIDKLLAMKGQEKIVMLSVYTAPMAELLTPYADILLVGDSVNMALYGEADTLTVTIDMMIRHGRAVSRAAKHINPNQLVVIDMPIGSVEQGKDLALENCQKILTATGGDAVKIEGGIQQAEVVAMLVAHNIPVMGHVGLLPQQIKNLGGFKTQGYDDTSRQQIIKDAKAIADAGAFALVVESVVESLAKAITDQITIPTIGIGASSYCDGQVLVADDMVGLTFSSRRKKPKFLRAFANVSQEVTEAASRFRDAVKQGKFPNQEEVY